MLTNISVIDGNRIKHGTLIRLTVNGTIYTIASTYIPITYQGVEYKALGHFLGINQMQDDLKITNNMVQITLSGIPADNTEPDTPSYMGLILDNKIKGSRVEVFRIFFNPDTNEFLESQTSKRFSGYISNFTLTDSIDSLNRVATNNIVIQCSSIHAVIEKKITGRRTNPTDQHLLYPNDIGLDRVITISNTSFDFGKPYVAPV